MFAKVLRTLIPIAILGACGYGAWWIISHPPKLTMAEAPATLIQVKARVLQPTAHEVWVRTQGNAQPRTRSTLLPEVTAKVLEVSPNFDEGGFFKKGDTLIKLDPVDYETALVVARAAEAQARTALAEEEARAAQAEEDWASLGRTSPAADLTLRKPQLAQTRANLAARSAEVVRAQRDVDRTLIRAPYDGQVLEQSVDVGQLVTPGTTLGSIFATDFFEVRLPLPERDMGFLSLPEHYQDQSQQEVKRTPVRLRASHAGRIATWQAEIVRVESAIDSATRQLMAVAQVREPYRKREDGLPPLKIGQFVEAEIQGEQLRDVFVIPRSVVRAGNEIILITDQNTLRRVTVEPLTGDEKEVIISANQPKGPRAGDRICLTPIPFPAEGARVEPVLETPAESKSEGEKKLPGVAGKVTTAATGTEAVDVRQ
jgi:membrane fusion protein, multidrug efflux system